MKLVKMACSMILLTCSLYNLYSIDPVVYIAKITNKTDKNFWLFHDKKQIERIKPHSELTIPKYKLGKIPLSKLAFPSLKVMSFQNKDRLYLLDAPSFQSKALQNILEITFTTAHKEGENHYNVSIALILLPVVQVVKDFPIVSNPIGIEQSTLKMPIYMGEENSYDIYVTLEGDDLNQSSIEVFGSSGAAQ